MKSHLLLVLCITRTGMLVWGTDCTGTLGVFPRGGASVSPFQPPILLGLPAGASGPLWMLVLRINKNKSLKHPGCTCLWEQSHCPTHLSGQGEQVAGVIWKNSRQKATSRIGQTPNVWANFTVGKRKGRELRGTTALKETGGLSHQQQVTVMWARGLREPAEGPARCCPTLVWS